MASDSHSLGNNNPIAPHYSACETCASLYTMKKKKKRKVIRFLNAAESNCVSKMNQNSENNRYILQCSLDRSDRALQSSEEPRSANGEHALSRSG